MTQSCPVHALPGVETGPSASTDPSEPALTKNQKQKRRQKLSKRGRNQQQSADSTCASGLTDLGDCWSKRFRSAVPDSSNNSGDSEASATLAAASSLSRPLEVSEELHPARLELPLCTEPPAKSAAAIQYRHGNYQSYYGYRLGQASFEDPRLQVLQKQWFHNKRCLDIGCNAGLVTIAVAARFGSASMLGVDIDRRLIQQSCRNLSAERTKARQHTAALSSQPPTDQPGQPSLSAQRKAARAAATALAHVWFQQEDFVTAEHGPGSMDCVLCLSVTKWVHLNGGDAAVLQLFDMVHHVLSSGGHFVLEAQPWRSYKQAQRKTNKLADSLVPINSLNLRPDQFCQHLTSKLNFVFVRELHVSFSTNGFDRPIWILQRC